MKFVILFFAHHLMMMIAILYGLITHDFYITGYMTIAWIIEFVINIMSYEEDRKDKGND